MLENRRIVVTGANGALGRVVCEKAESLGAETIQLDLMFEGDAAHQKTVDLTNLDSTVSCFDSLGSFDGVFNIAGGFAMGDNVWTKDDEQWDKMFALNVTTVRNVCKAAVPHLLKQGSSSIVNIGAYGAREGQGLMSAYGASKSVVMRLTESLAEELKGEGINVNAVLPTVIDTPANRAGMPDADPSQWVPPEDLANAICFLGSTAARSIHGALLPVRGLS